MHITNLNLNVNIYFIDAVKKDVYPTSSDLDLLYAPRNSIFILVQPNHYEILGIQTHGKVHTLFGPTHSLVISVHQRLKHLIKV